MTESERRPGVALVTGGGRGIGRAISERLGRGGHRVAVNYLSDAESAQRTAADIRAQGGTAVAVSGDVTDPDAVTGLLSAVRAELGDDPAVVVNNVGEFALGSVRDTPPDQWRAIIDSNLNSAYYVSRAALPAMREQRFGRIVLIGMAQAAVVRGAPSITAYAVAKTGISVLARSLAVEEAKHGVTVNCIAPGLIDNGYLPPEQARWMTGHCPSGRLGRPEEVARAVEFVVAPDADYTSGAVISVSGGWEWENRVVETNQAVTELFAVGTE